MVECTRKKGCACPDCASFNDISAARAATAKNFSLDNVSDRCVHTTAAAHRSRIDSSWFSTSWNALPVAVRSELNASFSGSDAESARCVVEYGAYQN